MSRPLKMHKPIKAKFGDIINAVADGGGMRMLDKDKKLRQNIVKASEPPKPKR